jgi:hypothetical protein
MSALSGAPMKISTGHPLSQALSNPRPATLKGQSNLSVNAFIAQTQTGQCPALAPLGLDSLSSVPPVAFPHILCDTSVVIPQGADATFQTRSSPGHS